MNRQQRRAAGQTARVAAKVDWNMLGAPHMLPRIQGLVQAGIAPADDPDVIWILETLKSLTQNGPEATYRKVAEDQALHHDPSSISKCEGYFYCYLRLRGASLETLSAALAVSRSGIDRNKIISALNLQPGQSGAGT